MKHPWLTWLGASAVVRLLVRLRVQGQPCVAPPPAVVVCNHQSWLDPLLIIVALGPRRRVVFLAAREHVEKRPVLAVLVRWLGAAILVDRGSIHQRDILRAADAALRAGCYLALFPEGRINITTQLLQPLEPGATAIARRAGAPLVPLGIAGARELHFRRHIELRIGTPLNPATKHHGDAAVTEQMHGALLAALPPTPAPSRWQPGKWLGRLT